MSEVTGTDFPAERFMELLSPGPEPPPDLLQLGIKLMDMNLAFAKAVGYDSALITPIVAIPRTRMVRKENPQQAGKVRAWQNEHGGLITTREEFEAFSWPPLETISAMPLDYMA